MRALFLSASVSRYDVKAVHIYMAAAYFIARQYLNAAGSRDVS
jgi:hypothetical protein